MLDCNIDEYWYDKSKEEFYAKNKLYTAKAREEMIDIFCDECNKRNYCKKKSLVGWLLDKNTI